MKDSRRCTAKSKRSQRRCRRAAIRGGTVCPMHGGGSPKVKLAARDRLNALVDPAIATLGRAVKSGNKELALTAARDLLDRCGYGKNALGTYDGTEVRRLLQTFVAVVLANVADPHERNIIAFELRRLSRRTGDAELAASIPVPLPAPKPEPDDVMVLL